MSQDTITLSVDKALSGNPADVVFSSQSINLDRATYIALDEGHSDLTKYQLQQYRWAPKTSGDSYGVRRSRIKFTIDVPVETPSGAVVYRPATFETNCSLPVGIAADKETEGRALIAAAVVRDGVDDLTIHGVI